MATAPKLAIVQGGQPIAPTDILTPEQLENRLHRKPGWAYKQVEKTRNPLPVLRCGRYLLFDWNAVCEWMRGRERT